MRRLLLAWNYLWLVLEAFGLGTNYIKMISIKRLPSRLHSVSFVLSLPRASCADNKMAPLSLAHILL